MLVGDSFDVVGSESGEMGVAIEHVAALHMDWDDSEGALSEIFDNCIFKSIDLLV